MAKATPLMTNSRKYDAYANDPTHTNKELI